MFDRRDQPQHLVESLRIFLNRWHLSESDRFGIAPEKLAACPLPEPLRQFYSFAGQWPGDNVWNSAFAHSDCLLDFEVLSLDRGKLVFAYQPDGGWTAGTEPADGDPPVWVCDEGNRWKKCCDSLAQFLVSICLHETVFGAAHREFHPGILDVARAAGLHVVPLYLDGPYFEETLSFHLINIDPTSSAVVLVLDDSWFGTNRADLPDAYPKQFAKLFSKPASKPQKRNVEDVVVDPAIPAVIRQSISESQIREHQAQVDYHLAKIATFRKILEASKSDQL